MKNVLSALSNIATTFSTKMAEQEAITKKGFRSLTDKVNVVNSNVGVVVERMDSLEVKMDSILSEMKAGRVAPVQEPQIRNHNEHRTTRQYNAVAEALVPIKKSVTGEAIFGVCEDCGVELTSNLVVGYCKANGIPVYCPKCQKVHHVDSASRGIGKSANRDQTPISLPATNNMGHSTPEVGTKEFIQVRVCGCCGEHIKYTSVETFNESQRKAKELGLPRYVHGKCAKALLEARKEEVAQTPIAEQPVVDVLDDTAHAFMVLVDGDMTSEELATLKIAELRKYAEGKGYTLVFDGNEWNRNKANYIVVAEEPVEVSEEVTCDVPMVAESTEEWVPMTQADTIVDEGVAEQFSLINEDGVRLF